MVITLTCGRQRITFTVQVTLESVKNRDSGPSTLTQLQLVHYATAL